MPSSHTLDRVAVTFDDDQRRCQRWLVGCERQPGLNQSAMCAGSLLRPPLRLRQRPLQQPPPRDHTDRPGCSCLGLGVGHTQSCADSAQPRRLWGCPHTSARGHTDRAPWILERRRENAHRAGDRRSRHPTVTADDSAAGVFSDTAGFAPDLIGSVNRSLARSPRRRSRRAESPTRCRRPPGSRRGSRYGEHSHAHRVHVSPAELDNRWSLFEFPEPSDQARGIGDARRTPAR